jgi:general secretion pathway protein A
MYLSHFRIANPPFSITSDPEFMFFSKQHREAFNHLLYGIRNRVGFIEITGEIGCGKTTLIRALLNKLDRDTKTAFIFNSNLTEEQLMQTLLSDLGLDPENKGRYKLYAELNAYLISELAIGHNVVMIIDEAQNLNSQLLEQVRMLSNLETEKEKLLQIVLVGQPELRSKLNSPALRQLRQRIPVRYHLSPLSGDEVGEYIRHRLRVAGAREGLPEFDEAALRSVYIYSQGVPRLINIVCEKALLCAFVKESYSITSAMIQECVDEIEGVRQL